MIPSERRRMRAGGIVTRQKQFRRKGPKARCHRKTAQPRHGHHGRSVAKRVGMTRVEVIEKRERRGS